MAEENDEREIPTPEKYPDEVPVETKKEQTGIRPTELQLDVTLPENTAVTAVVLQDITGNGEPDNRQEVSIEGGDHSYELSEFELNGYQVWTKFILESHDGKSTPSISSYQLRGEKLE